METFTMIVIEVTNEIILHIKTYKPRPVVNKSLLDPNKGYHLSK